MTPATMRAIANGAGSRATARTIVVTFNIGAPTTNESRKFVEAPWRANDGAITDEQQEQNGCGSANSAPTSDPLNPGRAKYGFRYSGRIVSARPEIRMPIIVACQTFNR